MNIFALILIIIAVLVFLPGLFFGALKFLLWIGVALAVIALIVWLVRFIGGRNRV